MDATFSNSAIGRGGAVGASVQVQGHVLPPEESASVLNTDPSSLMDQLPPGGSSETAAAPHDGHQEFNGGDYEFVNGHANKVKSAAVELRSIDLNPVSPGKQRQTTDEADMESKYMRLQDFGAQKRRNIQGRHRDGADLQTAQVREQNDDSRNCDEAGVESFYAQDYQAQGQQFNAYRTRAKLFSSPNRGEAALVENQAKRQRSMIAIKKSRNGQKGFIFVDKASVQQDKQAVNAGVKFSLKYPKEMPLTQLTPLYCQRPSNWQLMTNQALANVEKVKSTTIQNKVNRMRSIRGLNRQDSQRARLKSGVRHNDQPSKLLELQSVQTDCEKTTMPPSCSIHIVKSQQVAFSPWTSTHQVDSQKANTLTSQRSIQKQPLKSAEVQAAEFQGRSAQKSEATFSESIFTPTRTSDVGLRKTDHFQKRHTLQFNFSKARIPQVIQIEPASIDEAVPANRQVVNNFIQYPVRVVKVKDSRDRLNNSQSIGVPREDSDSNIDLTKENVQVFTSMSPEIHRKKMRQDKLTELYQGARAASQYQVAATNAIQYPLAGSQPQAQSSAQVALPAFTAPASPAVATSVNIGPHAPQTAVITFLASPQPRKVEQHALSAQPFTAHAQIFSHSLQSKNKTRQIMKQEATLSRIKTAAKMKMLKKSAQSTRFRHSYQQEPGQQHPLEHIGGEEAPAAQRDTGILRHVGTSVHDFEHRYRSHQRISNVQNSKELKIKRIIDNGVKSMEEYNANLPKPKYTANMLDDVRPSQTLLSPLTAEDVLKIVFPNQSVLIRNLSKMLQTERVHQRKDRAISQKAGNNFKFANYEQQDVFCERRELEKGILKVCAHMAPSRQYVESFAGQLRGELAKQTDWQLQQMYDLVQLMAKYNEGYAYRMKVETVQESLASRGPQSSLLSWNLSRQRATELSTGNQEDREPLFDWMKKEKQDEIANIHPKLRQVYHQEKLRTICKELVFIAHMHQLKELLQSCFSPEASAKEQPRKDKKRPKQKQEQVVVYSLGDAIERICKKSQYGVFTNSELLSVCLKSRMPQQKALEYLMPQPSKGSLSLRDLLQKMLIKENLLKGQYNRLRGTTVSHERFAPTICSDGTLYLIEELIDKDQAGQIVEYVDFLYSLPKETLTAITKVVIDGCKFQSTDLIKVLNCFEDIAHVDHDPDDDCLQSQIMKNIGQAMHRKMGSSIRHLCLSNITVSNQLMKTIATKLLNKLYSLELIALQGSDVPQHKLLQEFERYLQVNYLQITLIKIKFAKIDLSRQMFTVLALIESTFKSLLELELPWCQLTQENAQDLFELLTKLGLEDAECHNEGEIDGTIRSLNLSYNPFLEGLNLPVKQQRIEVKKDHIVIEDDQAKDNQKNRPRLRLIDAFLKYLDRGFLGKLTHLDLSGIAAFTRQDISKLINEIGNQTTCGNLLSIHLSDLGINDDQELHDEITDMFYINTSHDASSDHCGGLYLALLLYLTKVRGNDYEAKKVQTFKYTEVIEKTLKGPHGSAEHNIMLSMSLQLQMQMNGLKKCGLLSSGLGIRSDLQNGSNLDQVVLTRKLNLPELIFNQDPSQDRNCKKRFFEIDHCHKWSLSDNHQRKEACYVCQKQKYSIIFYEREHEGSMATHPRNRELIPIEDPEFLDKLRSEYRLKYSQDSKTRKQTWAPLICGSVVNAHQDRSCNQNQTRISNMTFNRKLRMIRADVFTLLSISTTGEFFSDPQKSSVIKRTVLKFLEGEYNDRAHRQGTFATLKGWNNLLHQKCNQSQILHVNPVNQPDCVRYQNAKAESVDNGCNHYAFASFLQPGYHQFIIYDPLTDKAYCKEMIVDFNHLQMLYPEMPKLMAQKQTREILPPVFRKWIRDDLQRQEKAYYMDTTPFSENGGRQMIDNFEPERYMKDADDIDSCEKLLLDYFDCLQSFYLQCLARSKKYPEIDAKTMQETVAEWLKEYNSNAEEDFGLPLQQITMIFLSATKNDSRADRSLCRGELFDFVLRLANEKFKKVAVLQKQRVLFKKTVAEKKPEPEPERPDPATDSDDSFQSDSSMCSNKSERERKKQKKLKRKEKKKKQEEKGSAESDVSEDESEIDSSIEKKKEEEEKQEAPKPKPLGKNQTDVAMHLRMLLKNGMQPLESKGVIQRQRKQIQNDPEVLKTLGRNLKDLKVIYDFYLDQKSKRQFRWTTSALRLFDMNAEVPSGRGSHMRKKVEVAPTDGEEFWKPLTVRDIWPPFVHCMMTVLNENKDSDKYNHLTITEYYEWIARVALRYHELCSGPDSKEATHVKIQQFLTKLFEKQGPIVGIETKQ